MLEPLTKKMTQFVSTLFEESFVEFNYAYNFLTTCLNNSGQDHLICFKSYRSYQMDIKDMIWKLVEAEAKCVFFQNGCNV